MALYNSLLDLPMFLFSFPGIRIISESDHFVVWHDHEPTNQTRKTRVVRFEYNTGHISTDIMIYGHN